MNCKFNCKPVNFDRTQHSIQQLASREDLKQNLGSLIVQIDHHLMDENHELFVHLKEEAIKIIDLIKLSHQYVTDYWF